MYGLGHRVVDVVQHVRPIVSIDEPLRVVARQHWGILHDWNERQGTVSVPGRYGLEQVDDTD